MKKLFTTLALIALTATLGACGKNSTSKGGNTVNPNQCPSGHYWNGTVCQTGTGPGNIYNRSTFADGSTTFEMYNYQFNGDLRITDSGGYAAFLKDAMGICDRNIWGYSSGLAKCSTWTAGKLYLSFNMGPDLQPAVTLTAYPPDSYANYYINIGIDAGGAAYNPLILSSGNTYNIINNNQGFEIRANGAWGTNAGRYLIQIIVRQGTIADKTVAYELAYKNGTMNRIFARGTMKKIF